MFIPMPTKYRLNLTALLLILGVALLIWACSQSPTPKTDQELNTTEATMNLAQLKMTTSETIPPLDATTAEIFETATFGLGWFWGVDAQFGVIEGVIRTRAGYAGGKKADPDYSHLGDHTETVQIDYDPKRISYTDLLHIFWKSHRPDSRSWNHQYMNAVFFHNDQQRQLGEETKAAIEKESGRKVRTPVLPLRAFYRAEDYHQKYFIKRRSDLSKELSRIYPLTKAYVDSTVVARINGYIGGYGNKTQLARELEQLGLSQASQKVLYELVPGTAN